MFIHVCISYALLMSSDFKLWCFHVGHRGTTWGLQFGIWAAAVSPACGSWVSGAGICWPQHPFSCNTLPFSSIFEGFYRLTFWVFCEECWRRVIVALRLKYISSVWPFSVIDMSDRSSAKVPELAFLKHFPPIDAAVAAFFGSELLGAADLVHPCQILSISHMRTLVRKRCAPGQHRQQWLKEKAPCLRMFKALIEKPMKGTCIAQLQWVVEYFSEVNYA